MKNYYSSDYRVIAKLIGANMNITTDQILPLEILNADSLVASTAGDFILDSIVVRNASTSLTTAAGGVYTAATKGGDAVVEAGQVYFALTAASKFLALTLASVALTDVLNASSSSLIFSLTTAQGAAATADIYVYGRTFQKA